MDHSFLRKYIPEKIHKILSTGRIHFPGKSPHRYCLYFLFGCRLEYFFICLQPLGESLHHDLSIGQPRLSTFPLVIFPDKPTDLFLEIYASCFFFIKLMTKTYNLHN